MGNGSCCKQSERVDTLNFDHDKNETNKQHRKNSISNHNAEFLSISDSDEEFDQFEIKKSQFGKFQDKQKGSQLSTGQQYSFQSLPSEKQFSNFVTFQALPSGQNIKQQSAFSKMQSSFQKEMKEVSQFQNPQMKNSMKNSINSMKDSLF